MKIIWDEHKRRSNLDKHECDFADFYFELFDNAKIRHAKNDRFMATFILNDKPVSIIFKPAGNEAISLISMRSASKKEREGLK